MVSLTGSWMRITALSWLVYDLTGSPLALGAVTFANTVPTMLLALFGGAVADRAEKRTLLLGTQAVFMAIAASLAILTLTGRIDVWQVLVFSVLGGVAASLDMPARQSFLLHLVSREDLPNAIALNSAMFNGSRIVGPAIAGAIIAQLGPRAGPGWSFAVNAVTYLAVIAALASIRVSSRLEAERRASVVSEIREGIAYAWRTPAIRTLLGLLAAAGTFGFTYVVLLPVFARDVLEVEARGYGTLVTATGIGSTAGALAMASVRLRRPLAAILGLMAAFAALLAAFALSRDYPLSLALQLGVSGTMTAFLAGINSSIQSATPDVLRGRIMSLYVFALFGTGPLAGLLAGGMASLWGAQVTVLVSAAVCGAAALAVWAAARREALPPEP
ncbi:MAG: MFS transporter, partial [Armatimonadota bacterium]|nr:MFS transporter [Armatimonadota bacterium]